MISETDVFVDPTPDDAARRLADALAHRIRSHEGGRFRLAVSGGSTPRPLYRLLASGEPAIPWERVEVFFADERCVPPDHAESNHGLLRRELLDRLATPPAAVHRMRGEADSPDAAARAYEDIIAGDRDEGAPPLDLVLLGVGDDGHTASLFPGSAALCATVRRVVATEAPEGTAVRGRLTMTIPLLLACPEICFLVTGASKARVMARILDGPSADLPASLVRPEKGRVRWFLDHAAAAGLEGL